MSEIVLCQYLLALRGDPWRRVGLTLELQVATLFSFESRFTWPSSLYPKWVPGLESAIERACAQLLDGSDSRGYRAAALTAVEYDDLGTSEYACYIAARRAIEQWLGLPLTKWQSRSSKS